MLEEQQKRNTSVVALLEVDPAQIHMYGVATIEATDDPDVVRITGLVEKPDAADAPSNLAIIGRYVLRPEVFDVLEHTEPGKGDEIQLTDALQELALTPEETPAASTASSSAAAATTPATGSTTSRPSFSSPSIATTSGLSFARGFATSPNAWTKLVGRHRAAAHD